MDIADLSERLRKLTLCPTEEVPHGWFTRADAEQMWNLNISTATKRIQAGLRAGILETRKFRIESRRGCYPTPHYREIARKDG
jgi:Fic family protein